MPLRPRVEGALELRICILCESESHIEGMTFTLEVSIRLIVEKRIALVNFDPLGRSMMDKLFESTK